MNRYLIGLAASFMLLICMASSCRNTQTQQATTEIWMEIEPVQCLGNLWEKAWLEKHSGAYDQYPKGHPRKVEEAEKVIIRDFFESQGIRVIKVEAVPFPDDVMVCDACDCPQGYTLYILTDKEGAEKLKKFNFKESTFKESENG